MLWEHDKNSFQISGVANSKKNTEPSSADMWEPNFNGFQAANHCFLFFIFSVFKDANRASDSNFGWSRNCVGWVTLPKHICEHHLTSTGELATAAKKKQCW